MLSVIKAELSYEHLKTMVAYLFELLIATVHVREGWEIVALIKLPQEELDLIVQHNNGRHGFRTLSIHFKQFI